MFEWYKQIWNGQKSDASWSNWLLVTYDWDAHAFEMIPLITVVAADHACFVWALADAVDCSGLSWKHKLILFYNSSSCFFQITGYLWSFNSLIIESPTGIGWSEVVGSTVGLLLGQCLSIRGSLFILLLVSTVFIPLVVWVLHFYWKEND